MAGIIDWLPFLIPAGAAVTTGIIGANAAKSAAETQAQAGADANALLRDIYGQQREDLAPWRDAGIQGLDALRVGLGLNPYAPPASTSTTWGAGTGQTSPLPSALTSSLTFQGQPEGSGWFGDTLSGAGAGMSFGGPVGAVIGGAAGAISNLFGRGSDIADQITPSQTAFQNEINRIKAEVDFRMSNGTLTQNDLNSAIQTIQSLNTGFNQFASQWGGNIQDQSNLSPFLQKIVGESPAYRAQADMSGVVDPLLKDWQSRLPTLPTTMPAQADSGIGVGATSGPASGPLSSLFGRFTETFKPSDTYLDPSYQFVMDEAMKALSTTAAGKNMALSGGTIRAAQDRAANIASTEYGNMFNRFTGERDALFNKFATLSGVGQVATNQGIQAAGNYGNQAAGNLVGIGNAQAAGNVGSANAINNAISGGANSITQAILLRDIFKNPNSTMNV